MAIPISIAGAGSMVAIQQCGVITSFISMNYIVGDSSGSTRDGIITGKYATPALKFTAEFTELSSNQNKRVLGFQLRREALKTGTPSGMILLISENIRVAEMIQSDLAGEGFPVEIIDHYAEAFLKLNENHLYQIILLDFKYSRRDPFEICTQLKRNPLQKFLPLIGIVDRERFVDQLLGFEQGADDFILTPYSPLELQLKLRSIKRMIEMRKQMQKQEIQLENLQNIQRIMVTLNHYINNALTPLSFAVQFMEQLPSESNATRLANIAKDTVDFISKVLHSLQTLVDSGKAKITQDGIYKNIMFDIEQELNCLIEKNRH